MPSLSLSPSTRLFAALATVLCLSQAGQAQTATFDDLPLPPNSYWNGSDYSGQFSSGGISFPNYYAYDPVYGPYWEEWAYSNMKDTTTPGYLNQYSAVTGGGVNGSANYGIGYLGFYNPLTISLPTATTVQGVYLTNTTYAYLAMLNGYEQATAFSSTSSFTLTISGSDANGQPTGTPVTFSLAQGRNIVNHWTWVDLSSLGSCVTTLGFSFLSTDYGDFGINTPTYVAMDDLAVAAVGPVLHWSGSGTSGTWSPLANWGGAALTGGQALSFGGSSGCNSLNDLPSDTQICGLQFESGAAGFTLSGNRISLAGNITNLSSQTQAVNLDLRLTSDVTSVDALGGDVTIAGSLTGSGQLLKTGPCSLVLSGSNDYTGGTVIADGMLQVSASGALSAAGSLIVSAGTLDLGAFTLTTSNTVSFQGGVTQNGVIINNGSAYDGQAGTVSTSLQGTAGLIKSSAGTLVLCGADSYRGDTTVAEGTLELINAASLPNGSALIVEGGATLMFGEPLVMAPAVSQDSVFAVPEPGMPGLFAAAGICLLAARFLLRRPVE